MFVFMLPTFHRLFFGLLLCFTPITLAFAEDTLQTKLPKKILELPERRFISLTTENDLYGKGTDENYTNGFRLTYFDLGQTPNNFAYLLDDLIPTFDINDTSSIYYAIGHNLYTPSDIEQSSLQEDDRPYAAYLYGTMGLSSITRNHIDEIEASLGVVGPMAQGKFIQTEVHRIIDSPKPKGWKHQLKNELAATLSWRRRWPVMGMNKVQNLMLGFEPNINFSVGNVYTYAGAGLSFRLTPWSDRWQDMPIKVSPAMPGHGVFLPHQEESPFGWFFFGGIETRLMGRNIFLDGNSFRDSHKVDKKPVVIEGNLGVAFTFKSVRLSYTLVHRSKEFYGQRRASTFGTISLGYRF